MPEINSDHPTVFFRPAPEWRRVAIYCVLGAWLVIGVWITLRHLGLGRGAADNTIPLIVTGLAAFMPAVLVWQSAIRIDAEGIWRRRLIRWDLWPWEAFMDGKIQDKTSIDSFRYPEKPLYWRHLHLEFLIDQDRRLIHEAIAKVRNRPKIELPEELTISYQFRRHARLTREGIQLWRGKREPGPVIPWVEISPIELIRIDHDRRDFWKLEFPRPAGGTIRLMFIHGSPSWSGADAEVIAAFLSRHVPSDRLHVNAACGAPLDMAEYRRCIAMVDQDEARLGKWHRLVPWLMLLVLGGSYFMIATKAGINPLHSKLVCLAGSAGSQFVLWAPGAGDLGHVSTSEA